MPSPIAALTPIHPPDPFDLDDLALLYTAVDRLLEDRDAFVVERYDQLAGLQDKVKAHAAQVADRPIMSAELTGRFHTRGS